MAHGALRVRSLDVSLASSEDRLRAPCDLGLPAVDAQVDKFWESPRASTCAQRGAKKNRSDPLVLGLDLVFHSALAEFDLKAEVQLSLHGLVDRENKIVKKG